MSTMDKKQKQYLRVKVCRLMDVDRMDEARAYLNELCEDEKKPLNPNDPRQRHVRVTDIDGHTVEYQSVAACAKALSASISLINKAIRVGTPVTGKLKGYVFDADPPNHSKRSIKVKATTPAGKTLMFDSIGIAIQEIGLCGGTAYKYLDLEVPVADGKFKGWRFERCN